MKLPSGGVLGRGLLGEAMKPLIFLLLAMVWVSLLPCAVSAQEWVYLGKTSGDSVFLESSGVQRAGDLVYYWMRTNFGSEQDIKGIKFWRLDSRYAINCSAKKYQTLGDRLYNRAGQLIDEQDWARYQPPFEPIPPDSYVDYIFGRLCR